MKRAFTLLMCTFFSFSAFAQVLSGDLLNNKEYKAFPAKDLNIVTSQKQNAARGTQEIVVDYSIADESTSGFIWWMNAYYSNDSFKLNHAQTRIDTFYDVVNDATIPYASIDSYSIDTMNFWVLHRKYSDTNTCDTLIASIVKLDGTGAAIENPTPADILWSDTSVTCNSAFTNHPDTVYPLMWAPNLMVSNAEKVSIRLDYYSTTDDSLAVQFLFRDTCTAQGAQQRYCAANLSRFWFNSYYTWYLGGLSGFRSNMPGTYFDCNQSGGFTLGNCEAYYLQNFRNQSSITVHQSFYVQSTADQTICAGETVNLDGLGIGGSGNYSYEWTPNYNLVNNQAASTIASPDSSVTYQVRCIDIDNNDTLYKDVVIDVIQIEVVLPADETLDCGNSKNLLPSITGTSNASYQWYKDNNVINGATQPNLTVNDRGTYKLEVTDNDFGCVESDDIVIDLNTSQFVSFDIAGDSRNDSAGVNHNVIFDNTCTEKTDWKWKWNFGDNPGSFNTSESPSHAYLTPGLRTVTLEATDKNDLNCVLEVQEQIMIVPLMTGIEGVNETLNGSVTSIGVYPNPTEGQLQLKYNAQVNSDVNVSVMSLTGQTLLTQNIGNTEKFTTTLDLSDLAQGVYLLQISNDAEVISQKVSLVK